MPSIAQQANAVDRKTWLMMEFIQKIFQDVAEKRNLEHYITIAFIIIILALDIFNLASPDVLTEITLAVLALIVITSLNTKTSLDAVSKALTKPQNADEFFWPEARSLEANMAQANEVIIVGAVLGRTLRQYASILERRLEAGAKIRILVMDPDSTAPDQAVLRSKWINNRKTYIDGAWATIERVGFLTNGSDSVELGLLPYKPAFSLIAIDPNEHYGSIVVEMYPHHSDEFAPTFMLEPNRDYRWYAYFREQLNLLWQGCNDRQFSGQAIKKLVNDMRNTTNH